MHSASTDVHPWPVLWRLVMRAPYGGELCPNVTCLGTVLASIPGRTSHFPDILLTSDWPGHAVDKFTVAPVRPITPRILGWTRTLIMLISVGQAGHPHSQSTGRHQENSLIVSHIRKFIRNL